MAKKKLDEDEATPESLSAGAKAAQEIALSRVASGVEKRAAMSTWTRLVKYMKYLDLPERDSAVESALNAAPQWSAFSKAALKQRKPVSELRKKHHSELKAALKAGQPLGPSGVTPSQE